MCKIFNRCFKTKNKKKCFTNRLTIIEFKKKLKPINTKLSRYTSISKEKIKYGKHLIVLI